MTYRRIGSGDPAFGAANQEGDNLNDNVTEAT